VKSQWILTNAVRFVNFVYHFRKCIYVPDNETIMASQAITFFTAGSETIAITLSLTFYELALNKVVQDRLRTELREAVHEKGPPTCDMLENVKYLDMVVSGE
jgi:cytochrome P450